MSKRLSSNQGNTLYNYFQSPKAVKSDSPKTAPTPSPRPKGEQAKENVQIESDDEDIVRTTKRKRAHIVFDDSDDESLDLSVANVDEQATKKIKPTNLQDFRKSTSKDQKKPSRKKDAVETSAEKVPARTPSKDNALEKPIKNAPGNTSIMPDEVQFAKSKWAHESYKFLEPKHIKDANGRSPDHPDYDLKTLRVPQDFLDGLTPGMRQWWELKS